MKASFIIPTYNNEKTLEECLNSIRMQKFGNYEILVIDGGSTDRTREIAKKFKCKIIENKKRVEEFGRIEGIKHAKWDILIFVDADNILVGEDWLGKVLKPFEDKEIAFADTLYFSYRKNDKITVRYQALIGGDDPLVAYMGFYSRWNYFKNNWTDYPYTSEDKGDYLKIRLSDLKKVPAMGSNGFLVRKELAKKFSTDRFLHSDFVYDLINNNHNCFAKVKTGIIHNQPKFFPNKIRRMKRRANNQVEIKYNYGLGKGDLIKTGLYILVTLPVLYDTIRGFARKPDFAWFFHPIACFGELFIYGYYSIKSYVKNAPLHLHS
ncbi:MAG: glycosyltransferase family 2 protein [archaeon]|nr:glycosyltransferase family 2 protein [archaeon]